MPACKSSRGGSSRGHVEDGRLSVSETTAFPGLVLARSGHSKRELRRQRGVGETDRGLAYTPVMIS